MWGIEVFWACLSVFVACLLCGLLDPSVCVADSGIGEFFVASPVVQLFGVRLGDFVLNCEVDIVAC